jgi:hypothetical protein
MEKVRQLTSGKSGGTQQAKVKGNPLIPGQEGSTNVPAMYMSISDRLQAENERLKMQRHDVALAMALAPPPTLSPEAESELVNAMVRRMGAEPEHGVSLGMTNETEEDRLAELLASKMGGAVGLR